MAAAFGKRGMAERAFAPQPARAGAVAMAGALPLPPIAVRSTQAAIRVPLVTPFLLVLFCIVFALEVRDTPVVHAGYAISVPALTAFGALSGELVFGHGQLWRLFTAPLLHGSLSHLIGNAVVFAIVGFMLEPLIGPRWFAGLFALGALGGSLCSVCVNAGDIASVGASGAIMGVLAAAFFCGASARTGLRGKKMQRWALRLMLPSLLPLAVDPHIDYACHLGGLLAGLATGVVLLLAWDRGEDRPALGNLGAAIGAVSLGVGLLAFAMVMKPVDAAAVTPPGLIPETEMPALNAIDTEKARDLLTRFPHDPRAHLFRGYAFLLHDHDLADAEEQFRQALATKDLLAARLTPDFEKTVTVLLSLTVAYENRPDEARALGGPLCDYAQSELGDLYTSMQDRHICD